MNKKAADGILTATQAPHRPGTAPAPRLRPGGMPYGSTFMEFTVWLSTTSTETLTVDFSSFDGNATAGWDYLPVNGALTFAPGETSHTMWVKVFGDLDYEGDE